ncbi:hypothetical protein O181_104153 [Austropuccinia psidii MF-1]|uniref:Uncharacterized protein n=1 Tax=Austropuccinia psidii MF-1 TaxID=1389203 RepID=A0A9Q3PJQ5_9BASI|nr:hypothetical protein [Austropuccinia psidii MF-1]
MAIWACFPYYMGKWPKMENTEKCANMYLKLKKPNTGFWAVFSLLTGKYRRFPKAEEGLERPDDGEGARLAPDDEMTIKAIKNEMANLANDYGYGMDMQY